MRNVPDQKQLRSRERKDAKMKVSYVAAFLIGLLSLESPRAAPLGSGSVNTSNVADDTYKDNSQNNQFWAGGSGIENTSNVGDGSFDDKSQNHQFWSWGARVENNGNVGSGSNNYNHQNNQFWAGGSDNENTGNASDGNFDDKSALE